MLKKSGRFVRALTTVSALGMALMVGACTEDGTGPDLDGFDAEAALQDYEALDGVVNSSAWRGFQAMGTKFSYGSVGSGGGPSGVAQFMEELADGGSRQSLAQTLIDNFGDWEISAEPIISQHHRGVTFEWDPVTEDYVASERIGAPSNGVRFIVYETDSSDNPIVDQEIGFADLFDEGDNTQGSIVLRLSVTINDLNFLSYRVAVMGQLGQGEVMIDGFIRDEENKLDFAIDVVGSRRFGEESVDITMEAGIADRGFDISATVEGVNDVDGESGAVSISVRHGSESLALNLEGTETEIGGEITLNGELFATVSGDPDNPTFVGASGEGLTAAEIQVLLKVVEVAEDVIQLFTDLMEPAGHIILLGLIL